MNATARTLPPVAAFNARDLLDEISILLCALRDLIAPGDTLGSVSRSDLSCLYDFARRLPDNFPNLAAHAPDMSRLIGELLEPSADLGGVSRFALFSMLDVLAVVQHCAIDALRMEDEDRTPTRSRDASATPLRLVSSQEHPQPRTERAGMTPEQLAAFKDRVRFIMSAAKPLLPSG